MLSVRVMAADALYDGLQAGVAIRPAVAKPVQRCVTPLRGTGRYAAFRLRASKLSRILALVGGLRLCEIKPWDPS